MDVLRLLHSLPTEKRKRAMETGLTKDELPPRYARMLPRLALRGKLLKGESPRIPNGGIKIWERRRKTFPPQRIIDYFVLIDPGAGEDAVIRCITNWM
ncbi:MAG TPA: hypothetical protein EYP10_00995 [Armatimonadetes bacterium]|nr:hypothetical protein [Armatimonadota bacterium]